MDNNIINKLILSTDETLKNQDKCYTTNCAAYNLTLNIIKWEYEITNDPNTNLQA